MFKTPIKLIESYFAGINFALTTKINTFKPCFMAFFSDKSISILI
jgi:hypothetical protein